MGREMKYYLWDWCGTNTIAKQEMDFHSKEYANSQGAFTTFKEAKRKGILELKEEISALKEDLRQLRKMQIADVQEETR